MKILVYSSMLCPYCFAAKKLLKKLNLNFEEVLVDNNLKIKNKMIKLSNGRTTVPQVFFGENHIGGYDDIRSLEKENKLLELIK